METPLPRLINKLLNNELLDPHERRIIHMLALALEGHNVHNTAELVRRLDDSFRWAQFINVCQNIKGELDV
jgi:hypothetical protein